MVNYPTSLDNPGSLPTRTDKVDYVVASDSNDKATAIIALETKLGIGSSTATSGTVLRGTGTGITAFGAVNLTTDVTGVLPIANGGSGSYPLSVLLGGTGSTTASTALTALGGVPTTRTVNSHPLSTNVTVTSSDIGAVPTTTTVNSHPLSTNVVVTNADLGAVPTTTTVNSHPLSTNVVVTTADLGIASGSDVTTGTDNAKIVTAKALSDAGIGGLKSKVITSTRDLSAASGDVAYTGVGFVPTSVIAVTGITDTAKPATWGFADSGKTGVCLSFGFNDSTYYPLSAFIYAAPSNGNNQSASVKSYDADGFTLTWTKTGTPTGSLALYFICYR